jgi:CheY-like chemotaxis protein
MAGKRILLVEDESIVRETLRLMLRKDGHTVLEANNGIEALSAFRRERFDLVLIDFQIPFLKGDELAVKLKQISPHQPLLMLTGQGRSLGPDNPVDAVLQKPFDLDGLRQAIAKLIPDPEEGVAA